MADIGARWSWLRVWVSVLAFFVLLWIGSSAAAERTEAKVTYGRVETFPVWSPDSRSIAFATNIKARSKLLNSIWITTVASGGTRQLVPVEGPFVNDSSWSPDGKRVLFDDGDSVFVANADGSSSQTLVPSARASSAVWSPDGSRVAFFALGPDVSTTLFVVDADGTNMRRLTDASFFAHRPAWSPDGTRIAYVGGGGDQNIAVPQGTFIVVIGADGQSRPQALAPHDGTAGFDPVWSPDGKRIAFFTGQGDRTVVRVVDSDGGNERRLGRGFSPAWSPNGKRIAFARTTGDSTSVWTMTPDGKHAKRITSGPRDSLVGATAWSPDGRRLAFRRDSALPHIASRIWLTTPDGRQQRRLTTG